MAVRDILLLGNPRLYQISETVLCDELDAITGIVTDLHDTLMDFRRRRGAGRAIAAPQVGAVKRLIYMQIDEPVILINPVLSDLSKEMMEVWDDCMSFPDLVVRVRRHRRCRIRFMDINWIEREIALGDDLSELLQHETDHLNGILAVSRAVDGRSFALKSQKNLLGSDTDHL